MPLPLPFSFLLLLSMSVWATGIEPKLSVQVRCRRLWCYDKRWGPTRLELRGGQASTGREPFGWEEGEGCDIEDWKRLVDKVFLGSGCKQCCTISVAFDF